MTTIDLETVEKLATLSRIALSPEEKASLRKDMEAILGYVGEIQKAGVKEESPKAGIVRNVLREDVNPHESGAYTEDLLRAAPKREDGYVKVKKIL
ncbi:MAG TPA: Asp-tRNA(Asn)/Glu-tRNA(Gln) amidotransferase subunit GatC [Candidatus Paceibacterota bacterium]